MNKLPESWYEFHNATAFPRLAVPQFSFDDFSRTLGESLEQGNRIVAYFALENEPGGELEVWAFLADDARNVLRAACTRIGRDSFPSLSARWPQLERFEREISEQFGTVCEAHPWFKRVRYQASWTDRDAWGGTAEAGIVPGGGEFYKLEGEEVHEVSVGPVHAGVIEPGHFRFQCRGETVYHLEIALGYQHRGVERALVGGPNRRSLHYAETLSGDATIAHTGAYARVLEALAGVKAPVRAEAIRGIALELERLANHVGDLGALSGDAGYLPSASFCGRIRGDFLNLSALICGNRFGRGLVVPGGAGFDIEPSRAAELLKRLDALEKETAQAVNLLWETSSVMARFEDIGTLTKESAMQMGVVGPAARASGLRRDVRYDQPSGIFRFHQMPVSTYDSGDVFSRAFVRWLEVQQSIRFVRQLLKNLPGGPFMKTLGNLAPASCAVALEEGWRGEAAHVALTGPDGKFQRYKVVDASFHNWNALAWVLRGQEISDFPLCNKSFSLSYSGHDL